VFESIDYLTHWTPFALSNGVADPEFVSFASGYPFALLSLVTRFLVRLRSSRPAVDPPGARRILDESCFLLTLSNYASPRLTQPLYWITSSDVP
jgi:hypothetical protein